jgi:Nucleotidyltransferase domain
MNPIAMGAPRIRRAAPGESRVAAPIVAIFKTMNRATLIDVLRMHDAALRENGATGLFIFGSRALGAERRDSDLDLFIDYNPATKIPKPNKASPSRCLRTATPPSWAVLATTSSEGNNSEVGAAWGFTQSGGVWSQQGSKLVGTDARGNAHQGTSVALSADGSSNCEAFAHYGRPR